MNARATFTLRDDDPITTLAGRHIHTIFLTTAAPLDIDREIKAFGLQNVSLKQFRLGHLFQHRLSVEGLTPGEARRLTDILAKQPGVTGATVEHLISR